MCQLRENGLPKWQLHPVCRFSFCPECVFFPNVCFFLVKRLGRTTFQEQNLRTYWPLRTCETDQPEAHDHQCLTMHRHHLTPTKPQTSERRIWLTSASATMPFQQFPVFGFLLLLGNVRCAPFIVVAPPGHASPVVVNADLKVMSICAPWWRGKKTGFATHPRQDPLGGHCSALQPT